MKNTSDPTYRAWHNMLKRCRYPKAKGFERYGGRGITVCSRWLEYDNFLADMGPKPSGLTLERKDTNGNYEPDNCEWVDHHTQARNKTNNIEVTIDGERLCMVDALARKGMLMSTFYYRTGCGLTPQQAIDKPVREYGVFKRLKEKERLPCQ